MILKDPFMYYYQEPYYKTIYEKQQEHNKKNCPFCFRNTFEIYNCKTKSWDIFTPNLINYIQESLLEEEVRYCSGYYINYNNIPCKNNKIFKYPPLLGLSTIIDECRNNNSNTKIEFNDVRDIILKYLKCGIYYHSRLNDYVENNTIRIKPLEKLPFIEYGYNTNVIKNNYWVLKYNLKIVEELN